MIRSTFPLAKPDDAASDEKTSSLQGSKLGTETNGDVTILTNENVNEKKLNMLLGLAGPDTLKSEEGSEPAADELKVDVTLRTQLGQAPIIMLLFTVNHPSSKADDVSLSKVSISFEVGLNGRISVIDVTGLLDDDNSSTDDATLGSQSTEDEAQLHTKLSHVLETSQDIGILVEWVLRWVRQRRTRG